MDEFAGSGRGVQTRDGCSVEFYRRLAYMGELDSLQHLLPAGATVLELGCATGRLTRVLLERGLVVTAVDNSPEMLAWVPKAARAVQADIEQLALGSQFDVILLASHLINHPDARVRRAFVRCARRHAHAASHVLIQRHDPQWLENVASGFESTAGELRVRVDNVHRDGERVSMTLAYTLGGDTWKQTFAAVALRDDQIDLLLAQERLVVTERVGPSGTWIVARCGGDA